MLIELACLAIVIALIIVFFTPRYAAFAFGFIVLAILVIVFEVALQPTVEPDALAMSSVKFMSQVAIEPNPYTPMQVGSVYRGSTAFDGSGQKIAIMTCFSQPRLQQDNDTFCQMYSLEKSKLEIFEYGTRTDSGWAIETRLDTQWSRVFAPKATVGVFAAASNSYADLKYALEQAVKWKANYVSMSLGSSENSYVASLLEPIFSANPTITFLASSGDDLSVSYPSSSPYNISVGGTRLYIKDDGVNTAAGPRASTSKTVTTYRKEGEIDWTSSYGVGTGHGLSKLFTTPAYQANANTSYYRATPDISCVSATPSENGLAIYCNGSWMGVQGTSASCPILAGLLATANSARLKISKKALTRDDIMKALYNLHPPNSPVDTMADGVGFVNNRFVDFIVSLA